MSVAFKEKLKEFCIELTPVMEEQFLQYYHLLIKWNKVMNLTGITEYEEVYEKHFIDSLSLIKTENMKTIKKVIDVGTGAGFPGIPLKIVFPHIEITLLDSLNKRIKFLNAVIQKLVLENVIIIHGRAEDFARKNEHREKYDLCVSRAVANLSTLSEYCIPYIKLGGIFVSYKSGEIEKEIIKSKEAIHTFGGEIQKVIKFKLPETDIKRSLIVIKKERPTQKKYPRKSGIPSKEPLVNVSHETFTHKT